MDARSCILVHVDIQPRFFAAPDGDERQFFDGLDADLHTALTGVDVHSVSLRHSGLMAAKVR